MSSERWLNEFLERYGGADFPHRELLLEGLRTGECVLYHGTDQSTRLLPCRHYLSIYQVRMRLVAKRETDYARERLQEISALCEQLQQSPDEPVQLWIFKLTDGLVIILFAGDSSHRILGSIRAFAQDSMPSEEWEALWHSDASSTRGPVKPGE